MLTYKQILNNGCDNMLYKNLEKIIFEFKGLNEKSKFVLKLGLVLFCLLFAAGNITFLVNNIYWNGDPYNQFISNTITKTSFTILAEFVIGSLVMDFISKK